ncbi:2-C-methyl-D-erythritol 4-phosphate cytidylyltransferase [Halothermothrix orenii]|uniref:2-C-methyl-D-erythritol 4-phosphate cytidylyltransferase n=1 Tax=Halothermothrix orenii (strain H 168 / OCM 544 / DSM 9562) TaxID=373903 RepID=B8D099_HALOH|nr:2-C-methyl-D-erythritol 4-phosphate cytidylyltransferase [Halothermothrix orenii]ACL68853.1 2-C-methyl-D-erythritol 4-phosphate cytidylyltransferase [Halothermothrix orenii H 168]
MKVGVIIPAAGQGRRMGRDMNKQYLLLNGRPILAHTLSLFFSSGKKFDQITVVVRPQEKEYCYQNVIQKYFPGKPIKLVSGGETRRESVYAGLKSFSPEIDYVIIHDGARPLMPYPVLERVLKGIVEYDAVTTGVRVKDTIKFINGGGFVSNTPDRGKLIAVQTPQAFRYDIIKKAHEEISSDIQVTDDAFLVEKLGYPVKVIKGSYDNIKVTTPVDLIIAEAILKTGD